MFHVSSAILYSTFIATCYMYEEYLIRSNLVVERIISKFYLHMYTCSLQF